MAQQYFPSWLSLRGFLVASALSAFTGYQAAERTGFSTEGVVGWIVSTIVGGVAGGAVITWAIKKFFPKQ